MPSPFPCPQGHHHYANARPPERDESTNTEDGKSFFHSAEEAHKQKVHSPSAPPQTRSGAGERERERETNREREKDLAVFAFSSDWSVVKCLCVSRTKRHGQTHHFTITTAQALEQIN